MPYRCRGDSPSIVSRPKRSRLPSVPLLNRVHINLLTMSPCEFGQEDEPWKTMGFARFVRSEPAGKIDPTPACSECRLRLKWCYGPY